MPSASGGFFRAPEPPHISQGLPRSPDGPLRLDPARLTRDLWVPPSSPSCLPAEPERRPDPGSGWSSSAGGWAQGRQHCPARAVHALKSLPQGLALGPSRVGKQRWGVWCVGKPLRPGLLWGPLGEESVPEPEDGGVPPRPEEKVGRARVSKLRH